jgi:hypothetical protein
MPAFKRIFCRGVILDSKNRGFKAIYVMARSTLAAIAPSAELTFVCILVAVRALRKGHRRFEVPLRVAVAASYELVFANKWILGL